MSSLAEFLRYFMKTVWQMINWKKINYWKIVTYIIYAIVIIFAITAILAKFSIGGIKLLTVQSGSMEPAIKMGSVVFVKSQDNYQKGGIITFKNSNNPKETTTHRIIDIKKENNLIQYQTRGDANNAPDSQWADNSLVVGKVKFAIPYIGYPIGFARTLPGLIILIIIPATIIIYDEILNIRKEIKKRRRTKRGTKR